MKNFFRVSGRGGISDDVSMRNRKDEEQRSGYHGQKKYICAANNWKEKIF